MTSKVMDPSRIVSASAYLLFYRRRSDVPLGGPKIREIVARFDNPLEESEATSPNDSGEDLRLVANSSQHGSSSALTGVDQVHRRGGSLGIQTTVDPAIIQDPPAYREALENDDSAPLLLKDAESNDGLNFDEAIGMDNQHGGGFVSGWDFNMLNNQRRSSLSNASAMSDRSDAVARGSDIDADEIKERLNEFDTAATDDEYTPEEPPPDIEMDVVPNTLHVVGDVEGNEEGEGDEHVDEIHV